MTEKRGLSQDSFVETAKAAKAPADFSTDEGAMAYANAELDRLFASIRTSVEKHVTGWPVNAHDRELNTYEALRHTFRNLSIAHAGYVEGDYENPTLTKMGGTNRIQLQQQSPDCNYHTCILHGDYSYRLRGYRGTSAIFQAAVYNSHACDFVGGWKMISLANNIDNPQFAPGAAIDVILSREKPDDLGNRVWLQLAEGRCELHLRQYYEDWENEKPADLMLTRIDQTFPSKLLDSESGPERFQRAVDFMRVHADFYKAGVKGHLESRETHVDQFDVPGAFEGTKYFHGYFRCAPDEAVVFEMDQPDCGYWNVVLDQLQWEPGDYWARLVSYNHTQVVPSKDGKIRLVASWEDSGVANWLDCSGRELMLIAYRMFRPNGDQAAPAIRKVSLGEVKAIFADVPQISPAERQAMMQQRLESVYRRRFNDF